MMTETNNPFKMLESNEEAPKELKEKVIRNVNNIQLVSDAAELLSVKYVETVQTLFETDVAKEDTEK